MTDHRLISRCSGCSQPLHATNSISPNKYRGLRALGKQGRPHARLRYRTPGTVTTPGASLSVAISNRTLNRRCMPLVCGTKSSPGTDSLKNRTRLRQRDRDNGLGRFSEIPARGYSVADRKAGRPSSLSLSGGAGGYALTLPFSGSRNQLTEHLYERTN